MGLSFNILKKFAKQVFVPDKKDNSSVFYGTVVNKNDDGIMVKLDGSDLLTPVDSAMDSEVNDRVVIQIKDHKAYITGNTTSPASARSATAYIKLTNEGVVIGRLINDTPSGSYCLIGLTNEDAKSYPEGTEFYYIINPDGTVAAKFGDDLVDLGMTDHSKINFCDGRAVIEYEHNVPGEIESEKPTDDQISIKSNAVALNSEVVDKASDETILAESFSNAEVYQPSLYDFSPFASMSISSILKLTEEGVATYKDTLQALGYDLNILTYLSSINVSPFSINITSPKVSVNNSEILTKGNLSSSIYITSNISMTASVKAHGMKYFEVEATDIPSEYLAVGIQSINNSRPEECVISSWGVDSATNKLWARVTNVVGSQISVTLSFRGIFIKNN